MEPFSVGDVVWLNSGGPAMTVLGKFGDSGFWECAWLTREGDPRHGVFPADCLSKVEPPPK